jgi:hypothetical protein
MSNQLNSPPTKIRKEVCERCASLLPVDDLIHDTRDVWVKDMYGEAERDHQDFYRCRNKDRCLTAEMALYNED